VYCRKHQAWGVAPCSAADGCARTLIVRRQHAAEANPAQRPLFRRPGGPPPFQSALAATGSSARPRTRTQSRFDHLAARSTASAHRHRTTHTEPGPASALIEELPTASRPTAFSPECMMRTLAGASLRRGQTPPPRLEHCTPDRAHDATRGLHRAAAWVAAPVREAQTLSAAQHARQQ
jgi:hypothetical protein